MDIRKLQRAIVDGLEDVKAQDIVVFNTEALSPLFERVIIASGTSNRQTKALASSVRETVKKRGLPVLRTEGEENGEWIIVDCGAAVAHIMQPAIRDYYRLEEIWGGKAVRLKAAAEKAAAGKAKAASARGAPAKATPKAPAARRPVAGAAAPRSVAEGKKSAPGKGAAAKTPAGKAAAGKAAPRKVAASKPGAGRAPARKTNAGGPSPRKAGAGKRPPGSAARPRAKG